MRDLDRGSGVLVVLHGHGDEPSSARTWGRAIAPPSWEVVAPGAQAGSDGVRSWFSTGSRGADPDDVSRSARQVTNVVDRVRAGGRPVVLAGFSQGGALALELARRGHDLAAVVAFNAFLIEGEDPTASPSTEPESPPTAPSAPVLILGGLDDEVIPSFLGDDAAAVLASEGFGVVSESLAGDHRVSRAMEERAYGWLRDVIAPGIKVSVALPVDRVDAGPELVSGEAVADLALGFEKAGFHATFVTDHPAPDDRWLAGGGHHALEPTVALAVAGAATRRLLLHTNIYVLAYRNPFLAAKSLASLDVMSGGRLVLGVAAGYLRPEFRALGVDFDTRGERLDEALELLPRIWAEDGVAVEGSGYTSKGVSARPRPLQRPHPPIWVGGNTLSAMRRAVRYGQGWSPFPTPAGLESSARTAAITNLDDLTTRLDRLAELRTELGRQEPLTVCFAPFSGVDYQRDPESALPAMVDEIRSLESVGVDWVTVGVPGLARSEILDRAAALAAALDLD
jgi:probable F420-dependent oxidoreductase